VGRRFESWGNERPSGASFIIKINENRRVLLQKPWAGDFLEACGDGGMQLGMWLAKIGYEVEKLIATSARPRVCCGLKRKDSCILSYRVMLQVCSTASEAAFAIYEEAHAVR